MEITLVEDYVRNYGLPTLVGITRYPVTENTICREDASNASNASSNTVHLEARGVMSQRQVSKFEE